MGDTYVISGLTAKRAEILGLAESLETKARQARADLAHIDAALRLFDPAIDLAAIRGKSQTKGRCPWFKAGDLSRFCREVLRDATESLSAETMVRQIMDRHGMDPEDHHQRSAIILRTLQTLHRMAKRGDVVRVGRGNGVLWTLPTVAARE
jgi:hypothetical protein